MKAAQSSIEKPDLHDADDIAVFLSKSAFAPCCGRVHIAFRDSSDVFA
jgi:hypothetical protein